MGNANSGRRTKKEEMQAAVELITEEALLKLARSKVNKQLNQELDFDQTKEIALPIVLKGMATKVAGDKDNKTPIPVLVKFINGNAIQDNRDTGGVQETV